MTFLRQFSPIPYFAIHQAEKTFLALPFISLLCSWQSHFSSKITDYGRNLIEKILVPDHLPPKRGWIG